MNIDLSKMAERIVIDLPAAFVAGPVAKSLADAVANAGAMPGEAS